MTRASSTSAAIRRLPNGFAERSAAIVVSGDGERLRLEGALVIRTLAEARRSLGMRARHRMPRTVDLGKLEVLDTPGALLLRELRDRGVQLTGLQAGHTALLDLISGLDLAPLPRGKSVPRWREFVVQVGKGGDDAWRDMRDVIAFVARAAHALASAVIHPRELRLPAVSRQVAESGVNALPIVGLMAIMISVVVGYQGVAQLRPYGADELTINLVAVSVLREMGVLITAIMVAGRSGSAFTAEIGVMKAREEVDALEVMGMDPMALLVVPRLVGLVVTLPLLTFFADVMGLLGGAAVAQVLLQVSPLQAVDRIHHAVDASDLFVGLVKAPFFAFFIGVIGCMHGLRVRGSAESVGHETTRAVVKSIFLVIVLDALFSILFERLGL